MSNDNSITLHNGVVMPKLIQGLPLILGLEMAQQRFNEIIHFSLKCNIKAFDTSHDYGKSERYLGDALALMCRREIKRSDLFIVTKIGNGQQYEGDMQKCTDQALKALQTDYIDLMLLHWPVPNHYIENWKKLEEVYESGKVKAIGIANAQVRHLDALLRSNIKHIPHVVQTEIHPFNTCRDLVTYCNARNIALQACSALCMMIPMVKENAVLKSIAEKKHRTIAQIILRWHVQQDIAPVFRSYDKKHLEETAEIYNFALTSSEMELISALNVNYRYHPESLNCPGF